MSDVNAPRSCVMGLYPTFINAPKKEKKQPGLYLRTTKSFHIQANTPTLSLLMTLSL